MILIELTTEAVIYWGDDATTVYNEAYTKLIGQKHPALQGSDPSIGFAEIWDHFERLLADQRETAQTVVEANTFLLLLRRGFLEETYFSYKFTPIIGNEGWVVGKSMFQTSWVQWYPGACALRSRVVLYSPYY